MCSACIPLMSSRIVDAHLWCSPLVQRKIVQHKGVNDVSEPKVIKRLGTFDLSCSGFTGSPETNLQERSTAQYQRIFPLGILERSIEAGAGCPVNEHGGIEEQSLVFEEYVAIRIRCLQHFPSFWGAETCY